MGKIVRMDDWDKVGSVRVRHIRRCDMHLRPSLHQRDGMYYITLYRRTREGPTFLEIKDSQEQAARMAGDLTEFLSSFIGDLEGWAITTTPARRHYGGFHFATEVCRKVAEAEKIPFYEGALQCTNKDRMAPDFHLLRPIAEERVILFDDIITTGKTLEATYSLIKEGRRQVLCLIGIYNA